MRYVGWLREQGGKWRAACEAQSWQACWRLLIPLAPVTRVAEKMVLPQGQTPGGRARAKRPGQAELW